MTEEQTKLALRASQTILGEPVVLSILLQRNLPATNSVHGWGGYYTGLHRVFVEDLRAAVDREQTPTGVEGMPDNELRRLLIFTTEHYSKASEDWLALIKLLSWECRVRDAIDRCCQAFTSPLTDKPNLASMILRAIEIEDVPSRRWLDETIVV